MNKSIEDNSKKIKLLKHTLIAFITVGTSIMIPFESNAGKKNVRYNPIYSGDINPIYSGNINTSGTRPSSVKSLNTAQQIKTETETKREITEPEVKLSKAQQSTLSKRQEQADKIRNKSAENEKLIDSNKQIELGRKHAAWKQMFNHKNISKKVLGQTAKELVATYKNEMSLLVNDTINIQVQVINKLKTDAANEVKKPVKDTILLQKIVNIENALKEENKKDNLLKHINRAYQYVTLAKAQKSALTDILKHLENQSFIKDAQNIRTQALKRKENITDESEKKKATTTINNIDKKVQKLKQLSEDVIKIVSNLSKEIDIKKLPQYNTKVEKNIESVNVLIGDIKNLEKKITASIIVYSPAVPKRNANQTFKENISIAQQAQTVNTIPKQENGSKDTNPNYDLDGYLKPRSAKPTQNTLDNSEDKNNSELTKIEARQEVLERIDPIRTNEVIDYDPLPKNNTKVLEETADKFKRDNPELKLKRTTDLEGYSTLQKKSIQSTSSESNETPANWKPNAVPVIIANIIKLNDLKDFEKQLNKLKDHENAKEIIKKLYTEQSQQEEKSRILYEDAINKNTDRELDCASKWEKAKKKLDLVKEFKNQLNELQLSPAPTTEVKPTIDEASNEPSTSANIKALNQLINEPDQHVESLENVANGSNTFEEQFERDIDQLELENNEKQRAEEDMEFDAILNQPELPVNEEQHIEEDPQPDLQNNEVQHAEDAQAQVFPDQPELQNNEPPIVEKQEKTEQSLDNEPLSTLTDQEENNSEDLEINVAMPNEKINEQVKNNILNHTNNHHKIINTVNNFIHARLDPSSTATAAAGDEESNIQRGLWTRAIYGTSNQGLVNNVSGYKGINKGGSIGFDTEIENDIIGIAYSHIYSVFKFKNNYNNDKEIIKSHVVSVYGQKELSKNFVAQILVSTSRNFIKNKVTYSFDDIKFKNNIKHRNHSYNVEALLNYNYLTKNKLIITPNIGLRYGKSRDGIYDNSGVNVQDITLAVKENNVLTGIIGTRLKIPLKNISKINNLGLVLHGSLEHNLSEKNQRINRILQIFNNKFEQNHITLKQPKRAYNLGTSIMGSVGNTMISLEYNYYLYKRYQSHQGSIKLKVNL